MSHTQIHPREPNPIPKMPLAIYFRAGIFLALAMAMVEANDQSIVQLNDDVLGLMVFKSDIQDPSSYLNSWNEDDTTPCSWRFVRCNPKTSRVSELSLDRLSLSGKISGKGLQKLQRLKLLSLSGNNFTGNISPELGLIPSLRILNLSQNKVSGTVPTSLFSSLKFLDISENSLSGPIPSGFSLSSSLKYLSLSGNSLQGPIPLLFPPNSTNLASLNTLNLSRNQFSGNIGDFLSSMTVNQLRVLDLSNNQFSGSLSVNLGMYYLKQMVLRGNELIGPLPLGIGLFCPHLNILDLSNNFFSGGLPHSLQRLRSLTSLDLSDNMLTGEFPQWIGNLSSLVQLDLSRNGIAGSLPWTIGNLKSIKFLSVSNNKISGNIPTLLASCSELSVIRVRGNSLNGSIPAALLELPSLEEVDFSNNELTALDNRLSVPGLGSKNMIKYINFSWNNLHTDLSVIMLPQNQNLTVFDLRNAGLYGSIPVDICDSKNLAILQLDGNSLTGPIPEQIGNCSSLNLLSLSHNKLSGTIPKSISNLAKLKILRLEMNELSGEIPGELRNLENLLAVNVSYNRLIGRLPEGGMFRSLDPTALEGNLGICSPLLKGPCKMNVSKPLVINPFTNRVPNPNPVRNQNHPNQDQARFLSISAIIAIGAAFVIVLGVVMISILNVSARKRLSLVDKALDTMSSSSCSSYSSSSPAGRLILFDFSSRCKPETLLENGTEIGRGVFGIVYRVSLEGKLVAIKKLFTSDIIQYPDDFDRQVRYMGRARHPNLVPLLGYYWTPHLQFLVSAYTPCVNLQTRLLLENPPLSWLNRFKIIMGTAKGLAYLHHSFRPSIIHYNIKPSNILIDENCNPKISDFGLARLLSLRKLEKHVMNNRFQNAAGYVAPELACQSLRVTEKCDVYSFGMLMMELVSGKGDDGNVMTLSEQVRAIVEKGNVLDCVDRNMGDYTEDEVLPVLKLALVCTSHVPSSRPSMTEVVHILQLIRTPHTNTMELF